MKSNFEKDPRRQPEKTGNCESAAFAGLRGSHSVSIVGGLTKVKSPDQRRDPGSVQRFLAVVLVAFTAWAVTVLKLASAISVACLTAFCTDSRALLLAEMALFITATAVSEPAGAFLEALSTTAMNFFCASVAVASAALLNSAPVPDAMSYRWRL